MSKYADRLAPHDDAFKQAERQRDLGELPEPGDYQAIVYRFDFFEAKSNGRLYLKTEMKVVGSEFEGWGVETIHDLEDPERFDFLKTHLHRLGLDTTDFVLSKIETYLPELLDVPVEVNVYEYQARDDTTRRGARVNKRLGDPMRQSTDAPAEQADLTAAARVGGGDESQQDTDDDVPF